MNYNNKHYSDVLTSIKEEGLYKKERVISTPQGVEITTHNGEKVLNFCANNYLGLANNSTFIKSAKSVRKMNSFLKTDIYIPKVAPQSSHSDLKLN